MSGSAGEYGGDNVIRPKEFERAGTPQDGGGLDGGGGGGGDMMLLARVAKLESDVEHIRSDMKDVKVDVRAALAGIAELRANTAILVERSQHHATREWVMWRLLGAFLLFVATLAAVVGYAPRIQTALGTAITSPISPPR